jgi:hypothetical protein
MTDFNRPEKMQAVVDYLLDSPDMVVGGGIERVGLREGRPSSTIGLEYFARQLDVFVRPIEPIYEIDPLNKFVRSLVVPAIRASCRQLFSMSMNMDEYHGGYITYDETIGSSLETIELREDLSAVRLGLIAKNWVVNLRDTELIQRTEVLVFPSQEELEYCAQRGIKYWIPSKESRKKHKVGHRALEMVFDSPTVKAAVAARAQTT